MTKKWCLIYCFWMMVMTGCAAPQAMISGSADLRTPEGQYLVRYPAMRMQEPAKYFAEERKFIAQRRVNAGLESPNAAVIGLALSGGGIRSNAFQLGLLSGLHKLGKLKEIDYLSAVSGGSWAAGAYKATQKTDEQFFAQMDAAITRDDMDNNDPRMHPLFNSYQAALHDLLEEKKDFLDLHVGYTAHEAWRKMLKNNLLEGDDPLLEDLNRGKSAGRPYLIFNATHDGSYSLFRSTAGNMAHSFPFEITADYLGTNVDCGNTDYCAFTADNNYVGTFAKITDTYVPPLYLSHAMAISGSVVPQKVLGIRLNMMYWKIDLPDFDKNTGLHRGAMTLSDCGHAENLGALALIERQVPLIILSDAAYDPKNSYGDLKALERHAATLFGVGLKELDGRGGPFQRYSYFRKSEPEKLLGTIYYLKAASSDHEDFDDYLLSDAAWYNLKTYLDTTRYVAKLQFPSDKTYATAYDYRLIFSYYLLGRYYGTEILAPEMSRLRAGIN